MPGETVGSSGEKYPVPIAQDPSALSTDALRREIAHLSDRIDLKIEGVLSSFSERIDAIDKATQVFAADLTRVPTALQTAIANQQSLTEEKFRNVCNQLESMQELKEEQFESIQKQFQERDVRSDKQAEGTALAVAAALTAQKEAVAEQARSAALATEKAERSQLKAIEQLAELIQSITTAINAQIDDLKERTTRIEAIAIGQAGQKVEQNLSTGMIVGILGAIFGLVTTGIAIIVFMMRFTAK